MKHKKYNAAAFISDEQFVEWVKCPTAESNAFWEKWLEEDPSGKAAVEEARRFIEALDLS